MRSARAVFRVKALTSSKDGSPQPRFGGVPKTNRAQRVPFAAAPCGGRQVRRQAAHHSSCRRRRTLRFVRWRFFAGFGPRIVSCDSTAARCRPHAADGRFAGKPLTARPAAVGERCDSYDGAFSQFGSRTVSCDSTAARRRPPPCGGRQVRRQAAHCPSCRRRRTLRFVRWRFFAGFGPRTVSCDSTAARRRPGRRAATHVPLDVPFRSARAETRSDAAPTARRFLAEACTLPAGSLPLPPLDDKSRTASPLPSARPSPLASAAKSIAAARSKDRQRRLLHA